MKARTACAQIGLGLVLAAAIGGTALAQPPDQPARGTTQLLNGEYVNGGIGEEQADRMRAMGAQYPIQMVFSERNQGMNEFLADVHVHVMDSGGQTVVDLPSQGPIFLLRVPPGSYTIEAEHQGQVQTRRINVAEGRHDKLVFSWS
ncbi:MAG TPA: hypothetical protein VKV24_15260 [Casimicrobiaceae bacterium]|nr:hypothetical protein [Casimicrobiaceae bacterium]